MWARALKNSAELSEACLRWSIDAKPPRVPILCNVVTIRCERLIGEMLCFMRKMVCLMLQPSVVSKLLEEDSCRIHVLQTDIGVRFRCGRLCLVGVVTFDEPFSRN